MTDAFTNASPLYQRAKSYHHESGPGFQEFRRELPGWRFVLACGLNFAVWLMVLGAL